MILKPRDRAWRQLAEQELELLQSCNLTPQHQEMVRQELAKFRSGNKGEQDSAYFLDVQFRETPNWIVLHDLRISDGTDIAQIDHLLINRVLEFYVLETKRHKNKILKVTEQGEFLVGNGGEEPRSLPSPIAQNDRHIQILQRILSKQPLFASTWRLRPVYHNYVLIHPDTQLVRPSAASFPQLCKADLFYQEIERLKRRNAITSFFYNVGRLHSLISQNTLRGLGHAILRMHRPERPDYRRQFGITDAEITPKPEASSQPAEGYFCFACRSAISEEEARFCFRYKQRFGGRAYCRSHQKDFPSGNTQVPG